MLKGKRVFVSGGAGVIGREMIPRLLSYGAEVFVGDLKPCPSNFTGNIIYRQGDLNYLDASEVEAFAPEIFIHLAATFERSTESYEFWHENFWHNVRLSNYLMTLVKDLPSLKKVVFASSYLIYDPRLYNFDTAQERPFSLKETDPIYPRNLTGMAKLAHEIELRFIDEFRSNQFATVLTRIYRGYGRNSRDVISRWIRSLLAEEQISVFRKEGIFDYIYAADTAEGLIRLAAATNTSGIINLGTGKSRKVDEVVNVLRKHFPAMKVVEGDSDIPYEASQADITLLKQKIGWSPEYDIEKAIPEIIAFEKSRAEMEKPLVTGNILVTSASRKVPLMQSMKKAAAKLNPTIKVFAGDMNTDALAGFVADGVFAMPRTTPENVDAIVSWCKENNVQFIVPTRDGELLFWANHKDLFLKQNIHVMISSPRAVEVCLDKLLFAEYCLTNEIPAIPTYSSVENCPGDLLVVKERWGAGSISIGIGLTKSQSQEHAAGLDEAIFQPMVKGVEFSVDAYVTLKGDVKGLVIRKRERVVNGESQITCTVNDEILNDKFRSIIEKLNVYGHIILQAIIDDKNEINIIECNCRFGGASTLGLRAGLDSFYWFLLEASGVSIENYQFIPAKTSIRQVRVPSDLYFIS